MHLTFGLSGLLVHADAQASKPLTSNSNLLKFPHTKKGAVKGSKKCYKPQYII